MTVPAKFPQLLVVGLGNLPFPNTRHSVGHLIVDALAQRFGIRLTTNRALGGITGRSNVLLGDLNVDLTLFKPKPLMNISGPAVVSALRHTTKVPGTMIVVHDSLEHKPKALSYHLSSWSDANFYRFRIGIGRDGDAATYKALIGTFGGGLDLVCKELEKIALKQPSAAR
ncbi:peptidyl-tRNA hydrolase [Melanogaster broomeanus]|nr:peptidyl-tRNA hydrolase [Melanogaster broomeanus]